MPDLSLRPLIVAGSIDVKLAARTPPGRPVSFEYTFAYSEPHQGTAAVLIPRR